MDLDDELCLCFHVSKRKVLNYLRLEKPRAVSQLADCGGAGTGCGWCRRFLKQLFAASQQNAADSTQLPTREQYACDRARYVRDGKGTPPAGATPIDAE